MAGSLLHQCNEHTQLRFGPDDIPQLIRAGKGYAIQLMHQSISQVGSSDAAVAIQEKTMVAPGENRLVILAQATRFDGIKTSGCATANTTGEDMAVNNFLQCFTVVIPNGPNIEPGFLKAASTGAKKV